MLFSIASRLILFIHFVNNNVRAFDRVTVFNGTYGETLHLLVDKTHEFIVQYPVSEKKSPFSVMVEAEVGFPEDPVLVVVRQEQAVTSWAVPLPVQSRSGISYFLETSRILCQNDVEQLAALPRSPVHTKSSPRNLFLKELSLSLSTYSKVPIEIKLVVNDQVRDFFIKEATSYSTMISPSEPKYFLYKFSPQEHYKQTVLLEITSEKSSCFTVSIQNSSCPVNDLEEDITFNGKYETVSSKGGFIISEFDFPNGFFIVFVAKGDDTGCRKNDIFSDHLSYSMQQQNQRFNVTFKVSAAPPLFEYFMASIAILVTITLFYAMFLVIIWMFNRWFFPHHADDATDADASSVKNEDVCPEDILSKSNLMLSDLSLRPSVDHDTKSLNYLWHVFNIGMFYGIPVVQLVITYQRVLDVSGDQDLCYYNFLCAHPLFGVSDFNHIFSNIGYLITGLVFLGITWWRHKTYVCIPGRGIPKHHGLFYAMGISVIMEGVLSASYHVCPNQSNFQFDTSFMYVIAVLMIVKLYQNRHPDINTTSYPTFGILGFFIFAAVIGILNGKIFVWITFIAVYIILCLYLTFKIYFLSYVKKGLNCFFNHYKENNRLSLSLLKPQRTLRFFVLFFGLSVNIAMACGGIWSFFNGTDFGTFLLGLLMGNSVIYTSIYIIMKLIHGERLCFLPCVFFILSTITWMLATYFFLKYSTMWTESPAESREWNTKCTLLNFYDDHDIWHMLSALALFFSFMLLMTLDDDLIYTYRDKIHVF